MELFVALLSTPLLWILLFVALMIIGMEIYFAASRVNFQRAANNFFAKNGFHPPFEQRYAREYGTNHVQYTLWNFLEGAPQNQARYRHQYGNQPPGKVFLELHKK